MNSYALAQTWRERIATIADAVARKHGARLAEVDGLRVFMVPLVDAYAVLVQFRDDANEAYRGTECLVQLDAEELCVADERGAGGLEAMIEARIAYALGKHCGLDGEML